MREVIGVGSRSWASIGAQLIASALGARVYLNTEKKIGWFPFQGLASEDPTGFRFPQSARAFHWHGETFDLPHGATRIARSASCENQAFQYGDSTLGLQRESARSLVENCRSELKPSSFIQGEEAILSVADADYAAINRGMARVLAFLFRGEGPGVQNEYFRLNVPRSLLE